MILWQLWCVVLQDMVMLLSRQAKPNTKLDVNHKKLLPKTETKKSMFIKSRLIESLMTLKDC